MAFSIFATLAERTQHCVIKERPRVIKSCSRIVTVSDKIYPGGIYNRDVILHDNKGGR